MGAGMDEYLSKPINKEKLAMTIKIFLNPYYKKQKENA
jgi:YesN/AraC family two-component response regulator